MKFLSTRKLGDRAFIVLSENMPTQLETLDLALPAAPVTDVGMQALAKTLPDGLRCLHLDFQDCEKLTNNGVVPLANRLPDSLRALNLEFHNCKLLETETVSAVAGKLPPDLDVLKLAFP